MALLSHATYMLCSRPWQSASRVEQVLHDHGLFLGRYNGLSHFRLHLHHHNIYPDSSKRKGLYYLRALQEPAIFYPHRLPPLDLRALVRSLLSLLRPLAHVHFRKSLISSFQPSELILTHKFIQYLLLTPTYINILNVYAFCNTHDITWGTKGDDKAEKLHSVTVDDKGKANVTVPQEDGDLNDQYDAELALISVKAPKEVKSINVNEAQEDYYKGFRSAVVLVWMFSNLALAAVVLSTAGLERLGTTSDAQRTTIYLAVVLWSVAGLSLFRFIGAMWFLTVRLVSIPSNPLLVGLHYILRETYSLGHLKRLLLTYCFYDYSSEAFKTCSPTC